LKGLATATGSNRCTAIGHRDIAAEAFAKGRHLPPLKGTSARFRLTPKPRSACTGDRTMKRGLTYAEATASLLS